MPKTFLLIVIQCWLLLSPFTKVLAEETRLNLVFAGNMPDYRTYSGLAELLSDVRAESPPTIFAFAGASLGPSPLSSLDRGSHIIDILNTLEPDLMTLTKREFSYFEDELTLRAYEAAFSIVSSNLYDPVIKSNLEGILDSFIVRKENANVGFISVLDEEVVEEYLLQRVTVLEPQKVIKKLVKELKEQGADLVVLVYSKERDYYQDFIANNQIDFALRTLPLVQNFKNLHPNGVYSIATKEPVTLLRISWNKHAENKQLRVESIKIDLAHSPRDSVTSQLIDKYDLRLSRLLNQKIGQLSGVMQTSTSLVRTREMPFGNFVADALRIYADADIGLINGGFIRGDKSYAKDAIITRRDIATELPFRARVFTIEVSGQQLRQALENGVSEVELAKGRFPQVSGLSFTYSIKEPAGSRVKTIQVDGEPIRPTGKYTIATTDYLANGGDGYHVFQDSKSLSNLSDRPPLVSDIVTRLIQQRTILAPALELRIRRLDE